MKIQISLSTDAKFQNPYRGARETRTVTQDHVPLLWQGLLGTLYARNPITEEVKYFDGKYEAARKFAKVDKCSDLRLCKPAHTYKTEVRGKYALWGILPTNA